MRPHALLLTLLFGFTASVQAQEGDDPPVADELKGNLKPFLDTGNHFQPIVHARFTKNDQQLVTVGREGSVQIWDVATGKRLKKMMLPVMAAYLNAALASDERTLAAIGHGPVSKELPNGLCILLVNLDDGRIVPLKTAKFFDYVAKTAVHWSLKLSAKGDQLGVCGGDWLRVWSIPQDLWDETTTSGVNLDKLQASRNYAKPKMSKSGKQLSFSPDGKHIAVVGTGLVSQSFPSIFEAGAAGAAKDHVKLNAKPKPQQRHVDNFCWSSDSKTLYTVGVASMGIHAFDLSGAQKALYPLKKKAGADLAWLQAGSQINQLELLNDDTILLSGKSREDSDQFSGYFGVGALDLKTGEVRPLIKEKVLGQHVSLTAVSKDRKLAATPINAGRDILIWNTADGKEVRRIESPSQTPVRVGWHKDKDQFVLAWGHDSDYTGKQQDKLTHAFDLDKLQFVADADFKAEEYTGRLHKLGSWLAERLSVKTVKTSHDNKALKSFTGGLTISAFTLIPRGAQDPDLAVGKRGRLFLAHASGTFYHPTKPNMAGVKEESPALYNHFTHIHDLAPSPEGKYLAVATGAQNMSVFSMKTGEKLLDLFVAGPDWVAWSDRGYYAASPGGEKLMGWVVSDGIKTLATYHPASRFRKQFYRPDVIKLLLEKGNLASALDAANKKIMADGGKVQKEVDLESVLPPSGFIDKVDTGKLPKVTVHASAFAANANDPLTKLELLADGKAIFGKDGLKELDKAVASSKVTFHVELPPGSHKLTVRIWSKEKNWSISTDAHVTFTPVVQPKLPKSKLHILAIGASEYKNHPGLDLPSPAKDAKEIAVALQKQCSLPLFAPGLNHTFIGKEATSANVYQAIKELKVAKEEDVAVIYFGGHGLKDKDGGLFLLTHDADMDKLEQTALSGKKLRDELSKLPCRVILILDACHSGALGAKQPKELAKTKPVVDDLTRELADDDCAVVVWCSAMGHQKAQVDAKTGHGLFTLWFLKALDDKGGAPASKHDGKVYLTAIQAFVFEEVLFYGGKRQHPSLILPGTVESFPLRQPPKMSAAAGG